MMKKILIILLAFTPVIAFSQKEETKISGYVSGGISIPGGSQSFKSRSYASIETGICYENLTAGLVIGRANLEKADFRNMFWEVKTSPSFYMAPVFAYGVFGYGGYMDYKKSFLEYGAGIYYPSNKVSYFAQITNWDEINYLSVGLTYNFKFKKHVRNN